MNASSESGLWAILIFMVRSRVAPLYVVVSFRPGVRPRRSPDHDGYAKRDEDDGSGEAHVDAAADQCGRFGHDWRVLDDGGRLRHGERMFACQTWHDTPRQKHDPER